MIPLIYYDTRYTFRTTGGPGAAVGVFLLALVLFPLLLGPEPDLLARTGPSLVWLMAGMASLLYGPALIEKDTEDGTLAQLFLLPFSPLKIFLSKLITHFLLVGLPLLCLSTLASPLYGLALNKLALLCLTFLMGLPAISTLSLLGSTLCARAHGGTLLIMLLILPFMTPLFVFALSAVDAYAMGLSPRPHLLLLGGVSILICVMGIVAGRYSLRHITL